MQNLPFRNQAIPMEVNERTALDVVLEKVEGFLRHENKNPALSLEIEGKLGIFQLKKEAQRQSFQTLEHFSRQNFILLDDKDPYNHNAYSTDIPFKLEKNFESGVEPRLFSNIMDYFQRVYAFSKSYIPEGTDSDFYKEYFNNVNRETKENITVDYVLGTIGEKKQRLSYELGKGLYYLEKSNKIHFDLLHNRKAMRVSINYEEKKDWNNYIGQLENARNIRIKHRNVFPYQFFEFHLTEVITIHENWPEFAELKAGKFDTEAFDLRIMNLFSSKPVNFEIEVEISDLNYLRQFIGQRDPFKYLFLRFLRNLESLYYGREGLEEISYYRFFGKNNIPKPIFGDYMMREALENEKRLFKQKK